MSTGSFVVLCSLLILIIMILGFYVCYLLTRLRNLEISIAELLMDTGKLKKVSVGNYLDITRIKKKLGIEVEDIHTGDTES